MAFFCLYSSKSMSSNSRRTLNRKYRLSSFNLILSLANLSAIFSISVAIARKAYPISKIFLPNNIKNGIPVSIDIKYLILFLNDSRGHIFFILFYISVIELFAPAAPSTNIFLKFSITMKSKNDKIIDVVRSIFYIVVFRNKCPGPRKR
jgi:hypothetical protein